MYEPSGIAERGECSRRRGDAIDARGAYAQSKRILLRKAHGTRTRARLAGNAGERGRAALRPPGWLTQLKIRIELAIRTLKHDGQDRIQS